MNEHEREMDLALAEAEQENRLLRARNERMQTELDNAEQELHELKDVLFVERKAMADRAHTLNNYEALIRDLTDALRAQKTWVGLTDEDRAEILNRKWWNFEDEFDVDGFLRLAEAKLKEKNT